MTTQGQIMPVCLADRGHPNPRFRYEDKECETGARHNCQTATVAYLLRKWGFDIEAKLNPVVKFNGTTIIIPGTNIRAREMNYFCGKEMKYEERFLNSDGTPAIPIKSSTADVRDSAFSKRQFIENYTMEEGVYEVCVKWKSEDSGHVFIVEKQKNGNRMWYDPQSAEINTFVTRYMNEAEPDLIEVLRVDDKLINPKFASRFLRSTL